MRSLKKIDVHEKEVLDKRADQAKSNEEASSVVQDYGRIIRSKKKGF